MLQCRSGKRTGKGAVKIAVDMVNEGIVDTHAAIKMVEPQHLDQLLHPQVELCKRLQFMVLGTLPITITNYVYLIYAINSKKHYRVNTEIDNIWRGK